MSFPFQVFSLRSTERCRRIGRKRRWRKPRHQCRSLCRHYLHSQRRLRGNCGRLTFRHSSPTSRQVENVGPKKKLRPRFLWVSVSISRTKTPAYRLSEDVQWMLRRQVSVGWRRRKFGKLLVVVHLHLHLHRLRFLRFGRQRCRRRRRRRLGGHRNAFAGPLNGTSRCQSDSRAA